MTNHYNVHIYREMRLFFQGIKADSPEQAAIACTEFPCEFAADQAFDCEGETFCALVDLQGDLDFSQSTPVDFEAERERKAGRAAILLLDMIRYGVLVLGDGDAFFQETNYAHDDQAPDWKALVDAIGWDNARASVRGANALT
jgi:hypothetical protein